MDPRKKSTAVSYHLGESNFLSSFSQLKASQSFEPTPKKPKLEITKNAKTPKFGTLSQSVNQKETIDDMLWGELDCDELNLAQLEYDETIALSQMPIKSQNSINNIQEAKKYSTNLKNNAKVPIRRFNSSQWPTSSSSFSDKNSAVNKASGNTAATLQSECDKLKLEVMKMKEEYNKKAGEATLLRMKMKDAEKQHEKITQVHLSKRAEMKIESEKRISSLQKEIQSLKGQIDVKNMELKTAERRSQMTSVHRIQPDSPNRLGALRPGKDGTEEWDSSNVIKDPSLKFIRDFVTSELLNPSPAEASETTRSYIPRLFIGEGSSTSSGRCTTVRRELSISNTCITQCAAMLLSPDLVDVTSDSSQEVLSQVVNVCHKILVEFLKQLESTTCSNNQFTKRERELILSGFRQLSLDKEYDDIISHRELYNDERGITARRALGLISILVEVSQTTAQKIISSSSKESGDILDTVKNIVRQIEKQRKTLRFQGVLAGSVSLILSLLNSNQAISKETQTLIVDVLRWAVLARPGCLVIHKILQVLVAAVRFPHIIDSLCHNSAEKTFNFKEKSSHIQFTPDSCILQVLCSLLRAVVTPRKHQLTDVWTVWVLSLFCSGQSRPAWLTVKPTAKSCQCHSLVCELSLHLLSDTCYAYPSASKADQSVMEKVFDRGVLLVSALMNLDEHFLAIVDFHSLGCYEYFLHFMSESKFSLNSTTRDTLEVLCSQEEVLKQPGHSPTKEDQNTRLKQSLRCFIQGDSEKPCSVVLDEIDDL
ncbi:ATR-interacting protein mus304-like [Macrosteles quadrilineatus]|uniref:ATR-interacting protein mus304-like n=1 Tax=Macrosteles quadrilineatus TaxID=74068 RepID=UPI0023E0EA6A|nr:ATR-interacting protein mus304-like [Macrosteles quadrilineatus]